MKIFTGMTKEEREKLRADIIRFFDTGFSEREVLKLTGITKENLRDWRKKDQMLDWHIIKALEKNE